MATATGTSVVGRQVLIQVPNPTTVVSPALRGASLGQTGKLGWFALQQNTGTGAILEMTGFEWWRDGYRLAYNVNIASVQAVMYWRKAGLLWTISTA